MPDQAPAPACVGAPHELSWAPISLRKTLSGTNQGNSPENMMFSLCTLLMAGTGLGAQLVGLNDSNFEKITQATTGSTTGNWLVIFNSKNCSACLGVIEAAKKLTNEALSTCSVALHDAEASPRTLERFPTLSANGGVVFIKNGRYLVFEPRSKETELLVKEIADFINIAHDQAEFQAVRKEATILDQAISFAQYIMARIAALHDVDPFAACVAASVSLLVGSLITIVLCLILTSSSKDKSSENVHRTRSKKRD